MSKDFLSVKCKFNLERFMEKVAGQFTSTASKVVDGRAVAVAAATEEDQRVVAVTHKSVACSSDIYGSRAHG